MRTLAPETAGDNEEIDKASQGSRASRASQLKEDAMKEINK